MGKITLMVYQYHDYYSAGGIQDCIEILKVDAGYYSWKEVADKVARRIIKEHHESQIGSCENTDVYCLELERVWMSSDNQGEVSKTYETRITHSVTYSPAPDGSDDSDFVLTPKDDEDQGETDVH